MFLFHILRSTDDISKEKKTRNVDMSEFAIEIQLYRPTCSLLFQRLDFLEFYDRLKKKCSPYSNYKTVHFKKEKS